MKHPVREQETIDELRRWIRLAQWAEWWAARGLRGTRWLGARAARRIRMLLFLRVVLLLQRRTAFMTRALETGDVSMADAMRHWFSATMQTTIGALTLGLGPLDALDEVVAFRDITPAEAPAWGTTPEVFLTLQNVPLPKTGS